MRTILSKFTSSPVIPHFRIQFPLRSKASQQFLIALNDVSTKSPAMFVSLNGTSENPQICNTLHDAFKYTSETKKVPLYAFLQDNINGLVYYIATASRLISANPFCRIGDITTPSKSYTNIHKLLSFFGVNYQRVGTNQSILWNKQMQPSQNQKQFTKRWLQVIKQKLKTDITKNRQLQPGVIQTLGNKLMHPSKALQLKLIDQISTVQQYKDIHFPNNKLLRRYFSSRSRNPQFNRREVQVLTQMIEWMAMPKFALLAIEDPINDYINQFIEIISLRLEDPQKLQELDVLAGSLLGNLQMRLENYNKLIV